MQLLGAAIGGSMVANASRYSSSTVAQVEVLADELVDAVIVGMENPGDPNDPMSLTSGATLDSYGDEDSLQSNSDWLVGPPLRWRREGSVLVKDQVGRDFADSVAYVEAVAALAEAADHHPEICIRWNRVTLTLNTHDHGGITRKDVELARQIDNL